MTHDELVARAAAWLRSSWRCIVVITEMAGGIEIPDAVGFTPYCSVLVECKASRSDFLRDRDKCVRRIDSRGMGQHRFYFAEPGIIRQDEVPRGWGLAEVDGRRVRKVLVVDECGGRDGWRDERALLVSCIRRLGAASVSGVSVKPYTYETKCRATVGVGVERKE